jgi:hypothetical protein
MKIITVQTWRILQLLLKELTIAQGWIISKDSMGLVNLNNNVKWFDFRCEVYTNYYSMQYAMIGNVVIEVLGGIFFFIAAIFVVKDRMRVQEYLSSKLLCFHKARLSYENVLNLSSS